MSASDTVPREAAGDVMVESECVALARCSVSTWRRLQKAGLGPPPLPFPRLKRWSRSAVMEWLSGGAGPVVDRAGKPVQVRG